MTDDEIRQHLHELADGYGSADELRAEVRERLEALEQAPGITLASNEPAADTGHPWLGVAAVLVALLGAGFAGVYLVGNGGDPERLAIDPADVSVTAGAIDPPATTSGALPDGRARFASTLTAPGLGFEIPVGDDLVVLLTSETEQLVEFTIDSSEVRGGHLVLAVPPVSDVDSPQAVVDALRSSLSQAQIVDVEDAAIGGKPATRVRLTSRVDMTLTGFRLGPRTFVSASGIDREYEAYVLERPDGGVLVVWVDATPDDIDAVRAVADVVAASLVWQP